MVAHCLVTKRTAALMGATAPVSLENMCRMPLMSRTGTSRDRNHVARGQGRNNLKGDDNVWKLTAATKSH